jgi:tRNA A37 N6-isopentenylltransferase MiaA
VPCLVVHPAPAVGLNLERQTLFTRLDRRVDAWIEGGFVEEVRGLGIACEAVPLLMTDHDATAAMVRAAFDLVDL